MKREEIDSLLSYVTSIDEKSVFKKKKITMKITIAVRLMKAKSRF